MSLLFFFISLSIIVSFVCSALEAVILSVSPSYLASLKTTNPKLYDQVVHLKNDIERPLASILTFNTIAHTIGAAGAGAEAQRLFGSDILAVFSAILTLVILFFSEIIPKSIGASSWKTLLPITAKILPIMIYTVLPLVWISEKISSLFKKEPDAISKEEISAMADLGVQGGTLQKGEANALKGLVEFDQCTPDEVMTKKENVKGLTSNMTIVEAWESLKDHPYSRLIVFDEKTNKVTGFALRAEIFKTYVEKPGEKISTLIRPLLIYNNSVSLPYLFNRLLKRREHICAIVDEQDRFLGIMTLEDLIEHMLNLEIYDEQDHLIPEPV